MILRRLARPKDDKRVDFLSAMLADGRENVISQEEVAAQGQNLVQVHRWECSARADLVKRIAGSETTATTLSAVMYFLMRHPDSYNQFKSEIRESFQDYEDITSSAVGTLPFFQAVINESMRLYPPVPFGPPRLSPGTYVDGKYIPKGVSLTSNSSSISCCVTD